jgi:hypothetical protein
MLYAWLVGEAGAEYQISPSLPAFNSGSQLRRRRTLNSIIQTGLYELVDCSVLTKAGKGILTN